MAVLLFLAGNGAVEQHRYALGLAFRTGHSTGFGNQQIGSVHQLVDLAAVAQYLHVGMVQERIGPHFGYELFVAAHAEDQLDIIHPCGE
ncbi:hypothetical protein D3C81_1567360 [compost metagenome]